MNCSGGRESELSISLRIKRPLLKNLQHLGRTKNVLARSFHVLECIPQRLTLKLSLLQPLRSLLEFLAVVCSGGLLPTEVWRSRLLGKLFHKSLVLALEHANVSLKLVNGLFLGTVDLGPLVLLVSLLLLDESVLFHQGLVESIDLFLQLLLASTLSR